MATKTGTNRTGGIDNERIGNHRHHHRRGICIYRPGLYDSHYHCGMEGRQMSAYGIAQQREGGGRGVKLGSLFDGSGGFPLAGVMHGVTPVWASEIEPYPVRVTTARFPGMKHLGDITKVKGDEIEPVDIVTFGFPCQDLSVAGKRDGLHGGERSILFYEAIRIIKEMRAASDGLYPRIAIFENVPGLFSSRGGEDFRAVIETAAQVKDPTVTIPRPANGRWNPAGLIVGNGFSIAWRELDAQYWGVPQRRRRIYALIDFGSERAGEILFKQEGVRGHSAESGTQRESPSANAQGSLRRSCNCLTPDDVQSRRVYTEDGTWPSLYGGEGGGHGYVLRQSAAGDAAGSVGRSVWPTIAGSLRARGDSSPCVDNGQPFVCCAFDNRPRDIDIGVAGTVRSNCHGDVTQVCYAARTAQTQANGIGVAQDQTHTLDCANAQAVCYQNKVGALCMDDYKGINQQYVSQDKVVAYAMERPLDCMHDQQIALYTKQAIGHYCELKVASTQQARQYKSADDLVVSSAKPPRKYIIRRLTPLECLRLQGLPDGWLDGVDGSDSAKYKMLGNGIAMPNAIYVVGCAVKLIKETQT